MSDDRETLAETIQVRITNRTYSRLLSVIGPSSTVSEYVRRLLEAVVNEPATFVLQTSERDCVIEE